MSVITFRHIDGAFRVATKWDGSNMGEIKTVCDDVEDIDENADGSLTVKYVTAQQFKDEVNIPIGSYVVKCSRDPLHSDYHMYTAELFRETFGPV